jgi:hypothetical protein
MITELLATVYPILVESLFIPAAEVGYFSRSPIDVGFFVQ